MGYIDKLAWIYIKDRKVLSTLSRGKDVYYIPGGKREAGETDEQALVREMKEELSIDLTLGQLKQVGIFEAQAHGKPEGTLVRMTCYTCPFEGEIKPSAEVTQAFWITSRDAGKSSAVDKLILTDLKQKNLID